jgi:hypothetical protein
VALTDDQKAMLRLLAQREQGYEDIAALMGLSVDAVRARVKEALEEIEESGQTVAEATGEPEAKKAAEPEVATEVERKPEPAAAPTGEGPAPEEPVEEADAEPAAASKPSLPKPSSSAARRPGVSLPRDQRLLAAGVAGVVAIALILVLALSGGSSPPSSSTTTSAATPSGGTNASASNPKLTQAILSPVNGGGASGRALFGRIKKTVVLQVEANGLEPSPAGESYTVWLYRSPKLRIPLAATKVGKSGRLAAQYPLPSEVISYLASGTFGQIDISLTRNSTLAASLAVAKKRKSAPSYTGTDVLRGTITGPFVKK